MPFSSAFPVKSGGFAFIRVHCNKIDDFLLSGTFEIVRSTRFVCVSFDSIRFYYESGIGKSSFWLDNNNNRRRCRRRPLLKKSLLFCDGLLFEHPVMIVMAWLWLLLSVFYCLCTIIGKIISWIVRSLTTIDLNMEQKHQNSHRNAITIAARIFARDGMLSTFRNRTEWS